MRLILTGSTGMVGEGVLHECLQDNRVEKVLVINRRSCNSSHPKLTEIIHADFMDLSPVENQLKGYDSCLFCLGVSSVGMKEDAYFKMTYSLTISVAGMLCRLNPTMVFCYISGAGTDSTEKGRSMWARVKGRTENDLMKMPFSRVYAFRPAIIVPTKGMKNTLIGYKLLGWLFPFFRIFFPAYICTLKQLGLAMIAAADSGYPKQVLEVPDIVDLAERK